MTRRRVHNILLVLVLAIIVVGILGWWYMLSARWPLKGDTRHDFGVVMIENGRAFAMHTYHLTNGTDEAITINGVRPSCGCLTASANRELVEPGESVEVEVTYTQRRPVKRKKYHIDVIIRGFGPQPLWFEASADGVPGPPPVGFFIQPAGVQLVAGARSEVGLHLATSPVDGSETPAEPRVDAPPGVTTGFSGWSRVGDRLPQPGDPLEWRGRMSIEWDGRNEIPKGASLRVVVDPYEPELVRVAIAEERE